MASGSVNGMELHPFLALKYEHMFDFLYDTMNDRNLSRQDFSKLQKRLAEIKGVSQGTRDYKNLQDRVNGVWAGLMKGSRYYRHNPLQLHLNMTEWLTYWRDFASAARQERTWPETSEDGRVGYQWKRNFVELIYDVMDRDGDGKLNREDYVGFMVAMGMEEDHSHQAFDKITQQMSNNQSLNREDFAELWLQYLTSENPRSHPGNYLMGILDLDNKNANEGD